MAAKPKIKGKEVRSFRFPSARGAEGDAGRLDMLASLVSNDKPDILATAYAPATVSYMILAVKALLQEREEPGGGRYPPMSKGIMHGRNPLPATVFSGEQKCLASAAYIPRRAAIRAQAGRRGAGRSLNRVRNPTYPASRSAASRLSERPLAQPLPVFLLPAMAARSA